ncbi:hypothetical protein EB835_13925 [Brevibacterium sp. S22]|nr:hypothetical protein EB835_13925 [Brevibacterium sp. S22]
MSFLETSLWTNEQMLDSAASTSRIAAVLIRQSSRILTVTGELSACGSIPSEGAAFRGRTALPGRPVCGCADDEILVAGSSKKVAELSESDKDADAWVDVLEYGILPRRGGR